MLKKVGFALVIILIILGSINVFAVTQSGEDVLNSEQTTELVEMKESTKATLNEYIENSLLNDIFFDKSKTYKKVKIITCTKQTLPDFKNRKVFLSIDADYVSNSGFDTAEDFKIVKTPEQVTKNFYSIFNTIDKKNIRPEVISLSLSPQYLPQEHHKHVQQIFNYIIKTAGMKDPISIYKRKYDTDPDYLKKKYGNTGN